MIRRYTADEPEMKSFNLPDATLVALRNLLPEAFSDGKIDFIELKRLLGHHVESTETRYGLFWHGKSAAQQLALAPSTGTLRPLKDDSLHWDTTSNIFIEGDNLEVLKLLQKSYSGHVGLIYIDPPYNTGKDFVYTDSFRDPIDNYKSITGQNEGGRTISSNSESSGRFHTSWLNMIAPRIRLARDLLTPNGVMIVSIDDTELANLKLLVAEVFGEENIVCTMIWEKGRKNDARLVSVGHEYLLIVARSLAQLKSSGVVWREEKPGTREIWAKYLELKTALGDNYAKIEHALQEWFAALPKGHLSRKWNRYRRIDRFGPWRDRDISWPGGGGPRYDVLHPVTGKVCAVPEGGWRFAKAEEMEKQIRAGLVEFRADHESPPFRKAYLRPPTGVELPAEAEDDGDDDDIEEEGGLSTQVRGTYFYKQSQVAVRGLRELMGGDVFDNPKDHSELARLFRYVTSGSNPIILDFFAGSGSTGHAAFELAAELPQPPSFILVQLPEVLDDRKKEHQQAVNFCRTIGKQLRLSEITKERLKRASMALSDKLPVPAKGFRAYRLDESNLKPWAVDAADLHGALLANAIAILPDTSDEDLATEVLLRLGLKLTHSCDLRTVAGKTVRAYSGILYLCFDSFLEGDVDAFVDGMGALHQELTGGYPTPSTVIFRDDRLGKDSVKTNLGTGLEHRGFSTIRSL